MLVRFPDATVVHALGRLDLVVSNRPRHPDFAVYLDERWKDDADVTWPYRLIDWPDFGLPFDEADMFAAVSDIHRRAKSGELVEIGCYGGVGRTGTVLACLAMLCGVQPKAALAWVRQHYHSRSVETATQQQSIDRFAKSL
jgi:protein-tyrosine phosphatase